MIRAMLARANDPGLRRVAIAPIGTMRFITPHAWDVTPAVARRIQADLSNRVDLTDAVSIDAIEIVAGVDNTYVTREGKTTAGAVVVVLTFPAMEVIETAIAWKPIAFPYVPGLLSFREAPAVLAACADLTAEPDIFLCDGQQSVAPKAGSWVSTKTRNASSAPRRRLSIAGRSSGPQCGPLPGTSRSSSP